MKKPSLFDQSRRLSKKLQRDSLSNYCAFLTKLCEAHSSYGYTALIAQYLRDKDVPQLLDMADYLSSQLYDNATEHFVANQFAALIRKYPFSVDLSKTDPTKNAYEKFMKVERKCARINMRFKLRRTRKGKAVPFEAEITTMRNFIRYVIGDAPNMADVFAECGFGPGASLGVHGDATNVARKLLSNTWTVSPGALTYFYGAVMSHSQFREILFPGHFGDVPEGLLYFKPEKVFYRKVELVRHNKIEFVWKTTRVKRPIAVEPLGNGFVQTGIGNVQRRKLKRIGLDLTDQEPNRYMAWLGSFDDEFGFCTVDQSSASDSVCTEPVRDLFSPDWFYLMDNTRSKEFTYGGMKHTYNKFCSMGNGFCFPLQTLIFAAACHAVGAGRPGHDFRVYGDDIIIRKQYFKPLEQLLRYLGFSTNTDKTFFEGPFRESCGADWFRGEDVRPYTLDHIIGSVQEVFKVLNLSRRNPRSEAFFEEARPFLLSLLPREFRFHRPFKGTPDSGIDDYGGEFLTSPHCVFNSKTRCWRWKELVSKSKADKAWVTLGESEAQRNAALMYGALAGSASSGPFSLRNTTRTKVRFVSHPGATSLWLPRCRLDG